MSGQKAIRKVEHVQPRRHRPVQEQVGSSLSFPASRLVSGEHNDVGRHVSAACQRKEGAAATDLDVIGVRPDGHDGERLAWQVQRNHPATVAQA
jgi:hypothetical protein